MFKIDVLGIIKEMNDFVKSLGMVLLVVPFWLIAIYLFKNNFYIDSDIFTLLLMAIVLAISSVFVALIFVNTNKKRQLHVLELTSVAVFFNILYLIVSISITYTIKYFFNYAIDLYYLIIVPSVLLIILAIIDRKFGKKEQLKGL